MPVETKDLYYAVYEAVVSLFGDMAAAAMQPSVLAVESGHAILRCRRGAEREFAIALSTLSSCCDCTIALRVLAVSGTIESLRERITTLVPQEPDVPAHDGAGEGVPDADPCEYRFGTTRSNRSYGTVIRLMS